MPKLKKTSLSGGEGGFEKHESRPYRIQRTTQPLIHKILNSKQYQVSQLCQLGITVRDLMECEISFLSNTKCLSRSLEGVDRMILSRVICKLQQGPRHQKQRLPLFPPLDY